MGSSDSSAGDSSKNQIVRRKFTLTHDTDDQLDKIANERYAGNRSQAVRASVIDHARTLDGESELRIQQVAQDIEEVLEKIAQLQQALEDEDPQASGEENDVESSSVDEPGSLADDDAMAVLDILDAQNALSDQTIVDESDLTLSRIQRALACLLEEEFIERTNSDSEIQYRIRTDSED